MIKMVEMFIELQDEIGGNLVAAHPDMSALDEDLPFEEQAFWLVQEDNDVPTRRSIVFRPRQGKLIDEAEGPFALACPTYFFELVPTPKHIFWRNKVYWFESILALPDADGDRAWDVYQEGIEDSMSHTDIENNPHLNDSHFIMNAWYMGWLTDAHNALPKMLWPEELKRLNTQIVKS